LAPLKIVPKISQQGDWGTYWDPVTKSNFQTTIQGTGGNVDPDTWLYETFHTGGGKNYMSYSNPEVDKLLEQGRAEADREKRKGYYDQAQTLIAQDAPMAFLYNMKQTDAKRDYVMGFYHMPTMTFWALRETWLNK
jgi:peptide/nickel transport system substrate-binding protein